MSSHRSPCEGQTGLLFPTGLNTSHVSTGMPCAHRLHLRLDCGEVEIGPLDNPRSRRPHLARWYYPLPDQPLEYRRTDSYLLRGLREREPVFVLREIRQTILIPDTRDTVGSPPLARPGAIAAAIEEGRNRQSATDLGERTDDGNDIVRGRTTMLPRRIARDPQLGVHPAVPVQVPDGLRRFLGGVDNNLMQDRMAHAFFERFGRRRMLPYDAELLA